MSKSLAERAVACKHWRWMPGMLALIDEDGGEWHTLMWSSTNALTIDRRDRWNHLPDLTDPATLGCLLALVREAWNDSSSFAYSDGKAWAIQSAWRGPFFHSETEAEALIKALEAAP